MCVQQTNYPYTGRKKDMRGEILAVWGGECG